MHKWFRITFSMESHSVRMVVFDRSSLYLDLLLSPYSVIIQKFRHCRCAPESLEKRIFTTKSDVWSLGVTLWETFSFSASPILVKEFQHLLYYLGPEQNLRWKKEKLFGCSDDMYKVMLWCWEYLPAKRPTFEQVLSKINEIDFERRNADVSARTSHG